MSPMTDHDVPLDRRNFLRLAGAGIALAGLDGCTRLPAEHILPYVDNRPELTPGVAQYYATSMCLDGLATGLLVESHTGRPTKIEGNPDHPASLGATGPIEQASVLQLYDPDRAQTARVGAARADWPSVAATLAPPVLRSRVGARGTGLRFLIEPTSSSVDEQLLAEIATMYPDAAIHVYAPFRDTRATLVPHYDISAADVIVAIDSDFLATRPFHLRYARQFADNRRLPSPSSAMNRLYVVETSFTSTGSAADHRFAVRPREIASIVRALRAAVENPSSVQTTPAWVGAVARDLVAHRGRALVVVGEDQSPDVLADVDAINAALDPAGRVAWHAPSPLIGQIVHTRTIDELIDALRAKSVDTLIVVGGNPSYTTPAHLQLSSLIRSVPNAGYVGLYENETARDARWFVPASHYLESWGDARAYDGTQSIVQPLVKPLHQSITPSDLYAVVANDTIGGAYERVRRWFASRTGNATDAEWADVLRRGVIPNSAFPRATSAPHRDTNVPVPPTLASSTIDVVFAADPKVYDGAFANNAWLQELPLPLTQLTWGNAAHISPRTAKRIGAATGDIVSVTASNRRLELPALVVPGHADESVTLHCGYGRDGAESVARGVGVDVYSLRAAVHSRSELGATLARAAGAQRLAIAQQEQLMEVSEPVRRATIAEYRASPTSVGQRPERVLSLYPPPEPPVGPHGPNQWAMTIDLSTCIGCGACVTACQAENNIPVVGADEVRNHRQMQWIRIDRYFAEQETAVDALLQPMLCQHCEKAPCEYVCPVGATVHSADGLNDMVYNRCVGTRFCSNNCPYKVRRFNWFDYNAHLSETELMVKNPNVTVRERGVMEKCTFCVQRIREAEIAAGRSDRDVRGSDVRTACQQSCPTNAIVFGSLTEPDSDMVRRRNEPRAYSALHELGTEPRVRYLARIRNPNPELVTHA